MQSDSIQKQMFSTNRKERIFNVRKVPYKQFDNQKSNQSIKKDLKSNFSPYQKKQNGQQPFNMQPKKPDYLQFPMASNAYKQLYKRYQALKQEQLAQKQSRLQKLQQREQQLQKYKQQQDRLLNERIKLQQRRDDLKSKIQQIRQKSESLKQKRAQRNQQIRAINMEYLHNMIMSMRYQNGVQIDIDHMSYEELLELQQKIGCVSKGITQDQLKKLQMIEGSKVQGQLCSICYDNIKEKQLVNRLPCQHMFHHDCIKNWFIKEKTCPLCKQQTFPNQKRQ